MKATVLFTLLILATTAHAQGTFQNLNFESATVPVVPNGQFGADVLVNQGLPGWSAFYDSTPVTTVSHNNLALSAPEIGILGPQWDTSQILEGSYSVILLGSRVARQPTTAAIAETGHIPLNAKSLTFFSSPTAIFQVTFGGQAIPMTQIGSGPNYIVQGGDISQFSGQTGELRFTAGSALSAGGILDNIQFSPVAVPEPSAAALVCLAGLALVCRIEAVRQSRFRVAKKRFHWLRPSL